MPATPHTPPAPGYRAARRQPSRRTRWIFAAVIVSIGVALIVAILSAPTTHHYTRPGRTTVGTAAVGERLAFDGMAYSVTSASSAPWRGTRTVVNLRMVAANRSAGKARVLTEGSGGIPREWTRRSAAYHDEISLVGGNRKVYSTAGGTFFKVGVGATYGGVSSGVTSFHATLVPRSGSASGTISYYGVPRRALRGAYLRVERFTRQATLVGRIRLGLP